MSSSRLPMPWRAFHVTVHTEPPPACALVALTPSSSALRAKTAYEGGGYEFYSHSGTGNCLLRASMTMQFPVPEYAVNSNLPMTTEECERSALAMEAVRRL